MDNTRVFYQDFLLENVPVDEQDNPVVEISYMDATDDYNSSDYIYISLDYLIRINRISEWQKLYKKIENADVIIKDDVRIENIEIVPYKDFYLKVYYFNLSKKCKKCVVMRE